MLFALSNHGLLESLRINLNRDMLLFWFLFVALSDIYYYEYIINYHQ